MNPKNKLPTRPGVYCQSVKVNAINGDPVLCSNPSCRHEIGRLYRIDDALFSNDLFLLQAGSLIIREGHSMFCVHCGQAVHFSLSDQKLEKIIQQKLGGE